MDTLQTILQSLNQLHQEGDSGNFVVFNAPGEKTAYVQIAAGKGSSRFWLEAFTPKHQARSEQSQLESLGWTHPRHGGMHNYYIEKQGVSDQHFPEIAQLVESTLTQVFGYDQTQPLSIELVLQ
ncbi:MAG: hypothetical protein AAF598_18225 [Bacteroidota bacterium]